MRALLEACGPGVLAIKPRLLVGGTNGKGTTCAYLESALRACGLTTGLYTSPHLVHPGERVRVSGRPANEETLARLVEQVDFAAHKALPDATFFEILTAVCLLAFKEARTDVDVVEVGLGGRLDSTNVLAPTVSVLTSVGLDHTEYLGPTLFHIATEKAWISRRAKPFVTGLIDDGEALKALEGVVARTGAIRLRVDAQDALDARWKAIIAASGRSADSNLLCAAVALRAFEKEADLAFDDVDVANGLARARWPGRFDARVVEGTTVVFDAAHNSHGFRYFLGLWDASTWKGVRPVVVYGTLTDKDWRDNLAPLLSWASRIVFTRADNPRAVPAEDLARAADAMVASEATTLAASGAARRVATRTIEAELSEALRTGLSLARQDDVPCVVIGSIALLGEAMERLEVHPFDAPG
jgi:dihydrofolate synthase/folylpolyglutamate synthase